MRTSTGPRGTFYSLDGHRWYASALAARLAADTAAELAFARVALCGALKARSGQAIASALERLDAAGESVQGRQEAAERELVRA